MMTREEVLSIEEYCAEHKISHKKRLEELEIPFWNFYKAKQKYRKKYEQEAQPGQSVQFLSIKIQKSAFFASRSNTAFFFTYWSDLIIS